MLPPSSLTLLDACAVVSLYATRRMSEILGVVPGPVAIVDSVEREAQYVRRGGIGEDAKEREPIVLASLVAAGQIIVLSTDDEEELLTFVDLAQELDPGEALTAALAIHRGGIVVTDDRKAERLLRQHGVVIRSTLDVVKTWCDHEGLHRTVQREVLLDLRQRGTYEPRRDHPLRGWWDAVIAAT